MSSGELPTEQRDFVSVVTACGLLPEETAREVAREAQASGAHPTELALRKGLLDPVEIDIVQTLLHPEEIVPDYEILGVLGKGGMGVVYRARQKSLDRIVALKTVLVSQMGEANLIARFEREAMTVARLQHPNIVAAFDFGRQAGRLYFAMEFIDGEDVEQFIRRKGPLDEATALGLIRQAAAGLAHATQIGIVHRDIKPANLLLVEPPAGFPLPAGLPLVKIADFGLALLAAERQDETRLTAANTTVGSPHYMAPEQMAGEATDYRADYYALGATLYHMLVGQPPFDGKTMPAVIAQKLNGRYKPLRECRPNVSHEVEQLLGEMMAVDPEQRSADYGQLIARIDAIGTALTANDPAIRIAAPGGSAGTGDAPTLTGTASSLPTEAFSSQPAPAPDGTRKFRRLLTGGIVLGLLAAAALAFQFFSSPADEVPPPRDMVHSGWSEPLFDGRTLGALPSSGSWVVGEDDEGGLVIAGTEGMIRRALFRSEPSGPRVLSNFRLTLFLRTHEAKAVELHFGISGENNRNGPRSVLRITDQHVQLARRPSDRGAIEPPTASVTIATGDDKYHVIALDLQHNYWWAEFDEQLIGTVPFEAGHLPEFRLAVEGGPAWFSDLQVGELVAGDASAE